MSSERGNLQKKGSLCASQKGSVTVTKAAIGLATNLTLSFNVLANTKKKYS